MKKTVLITGSSRGIGQATALLFYEKGWNVIATMRNPAERQTALHEKKGIDLVHLDVLDQDSIKKAAGYAFKKYSKIDAVINNAGYALVGPFELAGQQQIEKQFNINVLGLMNFTREIIPYFREQGNGVIVNISSMGGRVVFPFYSLYHGTKWAIEGFSESLHYELRPLNIKVKLIEPGIIKTDFYGSSAERAADASPTQYDCLFKLSMDRMNNFAGQGSAPSVVARTIFKAVNDRSWRVRYSTGKNAKAILVLRRLLPDLVFHQIIRTITLK